MSTPPLQTDITVTIIVPVYNARQHLGACVNSILAQTHPKIEVILIDDGSTDGSSEICDAFSRADQRVRVVHQENGGIASAQNAGLARATGNYITFCDNDDLLHPRLVEILLRAAVDNGAEMSCCRWMNVGASRAQSALELHTLRDDASVTVFSRPATAYQTVFSAFHRRVTRRDPEYFSEANWGKLYRATLFDGLSFPEGHFAQDVYIAMDLYLRMKTVASVDHVLYFWLQRGDSVSHSRRAASYYHDIFRAHARSFELALQAGITPARAYFGLGSLRDERLQAETPSEVRVVEEDEATLRRLRRSLGVKERLTCMAFAALRRLEVIVYDLTIHKRR